MSKKLQDRWVKLAREYGVRKNSARDIFNDIAARYGEPQRHYHTLEHIEKSFDHFDKVKHLIFEPDMVAFALFFHDIIYDPQSPYNEDDSAHFAESVLKHFPKMGESRINRVKEMILATKTHAPDNTDRDIEYLLDIDLAILGADDYTYRQYADNIRKEFSFIASDRDFMQARRDKFLIPYSKRELYKTHYFKKRFEDTAKDNITREISRINSHLSL